MEQQTDAIEQQADAIKQQPDAAEGEKLSIKMRAGGVVSVALSVAMSLGCVSSSAWAEGGASVRTRLGDKSVSVLLFEETVEDDGTPMTAVEEALVMLSGQDGLLSNMNGLDGGGFDLLENVTYDISVGGLTSSNGKYISHPVARGKVGIDVSEHNQEINWNVVKQTGLVDYAIIRCGYGQNYYSQDDKYWIQNVAGARSAGIPFGVYLYSHADSEAKALSEAEHVIRQLKAAGITPRELAYPVYYDMEDPNLADEKNRELLAKVAKTFCDRIQQEGYAVGIYANMRWFNNFLTDPVFDTWTKWVAQYPLESKFTFQYRGSNVGMWQCTSSGHIPGIYYPNHDEATGLGRVDVNFQLTAVPNYAGNTGNTSGIINRYPTWSGIFPDLYTSDWYFKEVKWANENGIITGYEDGSFRPNTDLQRQQLALILWRLAGEPTSTGEDFVDSANSYAAEAIRWAREVGITTGALNPDDPTEEPKFQPERSITREEFTTMLARYVKYVHGISVRTDGKKIGSYPDSYSVSPVHYDNFGWAVDREIIKGVNNTYLTPRGTTTRAQAATMLYRLNEYVAAEYAEAEAAAAAAAAEEAETSTISEEKLADDETSAVSTVDEDFDGLNSL